MTTSTASTGDQDSQQQGQEAQNQGQNGPGQPQGTPTPADVRQAQEQAANGEGEQDGKKPLENLDPATRKELDEARSQAARYRTEKNTAVQQAQQDAKAEADARVQAILKAAGIETGEQDDPEAAARADREAREQAETDARSARVELAVYRAAADKNADAAALLDSRSFLDRVQDVDPTDADAISEAIQKAVDANPRLAATQAAARSSADFTGGSGDGAITQEKFDEMDMGQRNALYQSDPDTYRRLAATS
ncbi:MAG: hypothetical protein L0G94_10140 [Brachybacterium sp.]|uniref:hypothetical protein n=1 Tax=Brachybacterium sp. TaxID=1891286 RepID=UPI00264A059A|nr:hypothetical protein [Brachybacterium sp.]MDN5687013.1 hypothetical protein [Brachybacterium sp.]